MNEIVTWILCAILYFIFFYGGCWLIERKYRKRLDDFEERIAELSSVKNTLALAIIGKAAVKIDITPDEISYNFARTRSLTTETHIIGDKSLFDKT